MLAVLDAVLTIAAIAFSIGYFFVAGVITHSVSKDAAPAGQWLIGLFMAVYALLILAVWQYLA